MQLQDYKHIASLGICALSLVACILHTYEKGDTIFRLFPVCMYIYFFADLTVNKSIEYRIHHIASLGVMFYSYYYGVTTKEMQPIIYHFVKTEISTIFLVFRYYLPRGTYIYKINNYVFYALFTKFRIIDFYQNIIRQNSPIYIVIQNYTPNNMLGSGLLISSSYVLYGLNWYWFSIMNRHVYREIVSIITKQ